MDKTREIPPNAAPRDGVKHASDRISALGLEFHDVVASVGLSRNTGYKLLRGEGSLASLRKIEEWLVLEESKRGRKPPPIATVSKSGKDRLAEWTEVGAELQLLDPKRFEQFLDGARELVAAKKHERNAMALIFQPTPGADD
jgi:hypothetical protein